MYYTGFKQMANGGFAVSNAKRAKRSESARAGWAKRRQVVKPKK